MRKTQFEQIMGAINGVNVKVDYLQSEVDALKTAKTAKKTAPTKTAKKSAKKTATKVATEKSQTVAPKKLADFEPKKYDGFYRWGMKSDGFNQKSYMGMRKAYCVFKATDGQFVDSDKAYKAGIRIDYSENGKYAKAKAEFEKKFKYVKVDER
jgi:hypothetical protein